VWAKPPGAAALTYHRDSGYFDMVPAGQVITVWIALDDCDNPNVGPLEYAPKSHLWKDATGEGTGTLRGAPAQFFGLKVMVVNIMSSGHFYFIMLVFSSEYAYCGLSCCSGQVCSSLRLSPFFHGIFIVFSSSSTLSYFSPTRGRCLKRSSANTATHPMMISHHYHLRSCL
jgi:hypothetical protein